MKTITQDKLDAMIKKALKVDRCIKLNESTMQHAEFRFPSFESKENFLHVDMRHSDVEYCLFENCDGICLDASMTSFETCIFKNCRIVGYAKNCSFFNSTFENCDLTRLITVNCSFDMVKMKGDEMAINFDSHEMVARALHISAIQQGIEHGTPFSLEKKMLIDHIENGRKFERCWSYFAKMRDYPSYEWAMRTLAEWASPTNFNDYLFRYMSNEKQEIIRKNREIYEGELK
jgi:hypothetical protein